MTTPDRDIAARKHEAREHARSARGALEAHYAREAHIRIAALALELPEFARRPLLVLAYAALPDEVDPSLIVRALEGGRARVAYPRVEAPGILGLHLADAAELTESHLGIREPHCDAPRIEPADVDIALVPGVAFDEKRFRLGYGGGYFDQLLPRLRRDALTVGLAYEEQMVDELPCEEHDVQLDVVVTPARVISASDEEPRD